MVLTFQSTHQAMHTESLLLPHIEVEMIPVPREISAHCGLALLINQGDQVAFLELMKKEPKEGMTLYVLKEEDKKKHFELYLGEGWSFCH